MKGNNIVYQVLIDSRDDDGTSFIETKLFYNVDDAIKHFNEVVNDFEKDCLDCYEPEDYIIERCDSSYSWYEDGYYSRNHYDVTLTQKEIL